MLEEREGKPLEAVHRLLAAYHELLAMGLSVHRLVVGELWFGTMVVGLVVTWPLGHHVEAATKVPSMAHITMAMVGGWVAVMVGHLPVVVALAPALGVTVLGTGGHRGGRLMG